MASPSPKKNKSLKTPTKKEAISRSPSPRSSPCNRQLSDVAKRLRDCCANLHENVQKWSSLNALGTGVANKLVNLLLQREYNKLEDATRVAVNLNDQASAIQLEEEIMNTSQELSKIYDSLIDVHDKMGLLVRSFTAIQSLKSPNKREQEELNSGGSQILFSTWTIQQFCGASTKLLNSFSKELALKGRLAMEFTRCRNRNDLMVYLSLWLHEPYLEEDNDVILESMLIEAELR